MREVSYERQTLDHPNPVARFAHRARMRRSTRLIQPYLTGSATLLDYGCGQGRFLSELAPQFTGQPITLLGYDPHQSAQFDGYRVVSDPGKVPLATVDVITSLEVCEHLSNAEMAEFVDFSDKVLAPHGRLLVSVPIMTGPALLAKELSRTILLHRRTDYAARDLVKAALLGSATPRADDIKASHRGFDWRGVLAQLLETFALEHTEFSPLPFKHWYGQSQVIMLFTKK
ncbi:methyltransferase domain-containing protein [Mycolicibacterium sp. P1-18]|uniref:class I SAM-dependent methyltransferase n=1 Tax=Mycolicibacterium sp. P1-18 TaxID=2024615 RepID=UPI0011F3A6E9|nr:methyltransferase domain-containing protein [Mycolicibacterium sp. P1-18]KAA0098128.1 methyltransferase domain-containing protein [Mycolicibacterium sp. P1-18]